jgi:hypothetical protein
MDFTIEDMIIGVSIICDVKYRGTLCVNTVPAFSEQLFNLLSKILLVVAVM